MEAPKCRSIPSCGKRHYGGCTVRPEKKSDEVKVSKADSSAKKKAIRVLDKMVDAVTGVSDICPECGTNLAAQRKSRERRRKWMSDKRAAEKGGLK